MHVLDASCKARTLDRDVRTITARPARERSRTSRSTAAKTEARQLFEQGLTIETVMARTGRARSTVIGDLCEMIEDRRDQPSLRAWMDEETEETIRRAAAQAGIERLRPIKDIVGEGISYDDIRIVVATLR
jgi:ATP-dependent DNA helicase RecQ